MKEIAIDFCRLKLDNNELALIRWKDDDVNLFWKKKFDEIEKMIKTSPIETDISIMKTTEDD